MKKKIITLITVIILAVTVLAPLTSSLEVSNTKINNSKSMKPRISYRFFIGKIEARFPGSEGWAVIDGRDSVIHLETSETSNRESIIKVKYPLSPFKGVCFGPPLAHENWDDYITYDVYIGIFFNGNVRTENEWIYVELSGMIITILESGRREFP